MPRLKNALSLVLLLIATWVGAQVPEQPCGLNKMRAKNGFTENPDHSRNKNDSFYQDDGGIYVIPVVFHVIYETFPNGQPRPENIPDSVIHSQIDVLNEDFGRYGKGFNTNPLGADAGIRFCLATKDPDGKPTTGIVRIKSPYTRIDSDNEMLTKNLSRWDQRRYLNIWVVREINGSPNEQGYSYYASDMAKPQYAERDGVVVVYKFVGRNSNIAISNNYLGHTVSHEVGHYLELKHPWGEKEGDCAEDDEVDDTPPCLGIYQAGYDPILRRCDRPTQCAGPRQIENYMDYSEDRCLNLFTRGQISRMRNAIKEYRSGLVAYANITATGCKDHFLQLNPTSNNSLQMLASPATNKVTLYPMFTEKQTGRLFIYDEMGKLIMQRELPGLQNDKIELYMPGLQNALYFFIVQTPHNIYSEKIIFLRKRG